MKLIREYVEHDPVWVEAPLRINRAGDTKPGFLCVHELENGNGWCGGNVFDLADADDKHGCCIMVRAGWKISRPNYDKPHRCPGWAGGGWKGAKYKLCHGDGGTIQIDYNNRWWKWKTYQCENCQVTVLPYMVRWTDLVSWWYFFKYARNSWWWLVKLETKWGKWTGRW